MFKGKNIFTCPCCLRQALSLRVDKHNKEYFSCQCGLKMFGFKPRDIMNFDLIGLIVATEPFRKALVEHVRKSFPGFTRWLSYADVLKLREDREPSDVPADEIFK